jgi:hypothetical protein
MAELHALLGLREEAAITRDWLVPSENSAALAGSGWGMPAFRRTRSTIRKKFPRVGAMPPTVPGTVADATFRMTPTPAGPPASGAATASPTLPTPPSRSPRLLPVLLEQASSTRPAER